MRLERAVLSTPGAAAEAALGPAGMCRTLKAGGRHLAQMQQRLRRGTDPNAAGVGFGPAGPHTAAVQAGLRGKAAPLPFQGLVGSATFSCTRVGSRERRA